MRGIIFRTAKAAFKKAYKKHKSEVSRAKKQGTPVVPYSLIKADIKRKIRGTKFTAAAEFKAQPGLKRRIRVGIERAKREKKKFRKPVILGKAYASDKKGKTMQIQPLTFKQRKQMKKEMEESAKRNYARLFSRNKKRGGLSTIKMVKSKLEKASEAHAGQAKALGKVIDKKKLLLGGLLTKGIKSVYKAYRKAGGRKTSDIVKESKVSRSLAKTDIKQGLAGSLKSKRTSAMVQRDYLKNKSGTFNRIQRKKKQKEVRDLTAEINALQVK